MSENKLDNEFFINRDPDHVKKKKNMKSKDFVCISRKILEDTSISLKAKSYYVKLEAGSITEADIPTNLLREMLKIYFIIGREV